MRQENKTGIQLTVPLIWLMTGVLSWYLSLYLFSYLLSPVLIDAVREANAMTRSVFLKITANLLFTKVADFTLCFLFSMLLGYLTKPTRLRLLLFIIGAIAVSLYGHMESLIHYMRIYSGLPSWALASLLQGGISILLIIPLLSFAGSKGGHYLRLKKSRS